MATDLDPEKQAQLGLRRAQQQPAQQQPRLGMTLTPEQISTNTKKDQLDRSRERQAEFRAGVGNTLDRLGNSAVNLANMPGRIAIEGARQIGDFVGNTRFDNSLPDYGNHGLLKRRAENFVQNNPEQAEAARLGLMDVAGRATTAAMEAVKAAPLPAVSLNRPATQPDPGSGPLATGSSAQKTTATPMGAAATTGAQPRLGFQRTGVDGVVGRVGADGVMEFSNAAGDVAGAADTQLQAGRMSNGVGGMSVGEAGDSQMALDRFQRANDIRGQARLGLRRSQIGGDGGLVVVGSSGDGMERARERRLASIDGPQMAGGLRRAREAGMKHEMETAGLGLRRDEAASRERIEADRLAQGERIASEDRALRAREIANAEATGNIERQRLGVELETGQVALAQQRRVEALRSQLADPSLDPATRVQLERAYNALTTPAKDRYMLQDTVMGHDAQGAPIFGKAALDVATGQLVGQQGGQLAAQPQQFEKGKIYRDGSGARARFNGMDAQGNPQWEAI